LLDKTNVKYVLSATSGMDHVDFNFLTKANIACLDAKGGNAQSVSDYVMSIVSEQADNLNGNLVGIIGVGEVGGRVAQTLREFQFNVLCHDPLRASSEKDFDSHSLLDLQKCDIISLHVPLTFTLPNPTYHLIDHSFLSSLTPNTLIINTSRGGVINENALIENEYNLRICLDVFKNEPTPDKKVLDLCLSATPHIAGHAIEAKWRTSLMIYRKLCLMLGYPYKDTDYDHLLDAQKKPLSLSDFKKHYSTKIETKALKKMQSKEDFVNLRKSHLRHEQT
jgi:erythronate-4-phosphate dehydrogenase